MAELKQFWSQYKSPLTEAGEQLQKVGNDYWTRDYRKERREMQKAFEELQLDIQKTKFEWDKQFVPKERQSKLDSEATQRGYMRALTGYTAENQRGAEINNDWNQSKNTYTLGGIYGGMHNQSKQTRLQDIEYLESLLQNEKDPKRQEYLKREIATLNAQDAFTPLPDNQPEDVNIYQVLGLPFKIKNGKAIVLSNASDPAIMKAVAYYDSFDILPMHEKQAILRFAQTGKLDIPLSKQGHHVLEGVKDAYKMKLIKNYKELEKFNTNNSRLLGTMQQISKIMGENPNIFKQSSGFIDNRLNDINAYLGINDQRMEATANVKRAINAIKIAALKESITGSPSDYDAKMFESSFVNLNHSDKQVLKSYVSYLEQTRNTWENMASNYDAITQHLFFEKKINTIQKMIDAFSIQGIENGQIATYASHKR